MSAKTKTCLALLSLAGWLLVAPVALADKGEQLIEAAQHQDIETVRKLLAEGVDVDSKNRYGATALFYAADKGNLEIVTLLLEKGAEINVTDTFYQATPLTWSLFKSAESAPHKKIALVLLEKGAEGADSALGFGIRGGDLELVKAAVEKGEIEPKSLLDSLTAARESGHEEIIAYLEGKAPAEAPEPEIEVSAEQLATYVGDYRNDDIGMQAKVFLDGELLKLQAAGQQALVLKATGDNAFAARDVPGIELGFRGRGGLIEGFLLRQGGQELYFPRFDADAPAVAETSDELPPLPKAERTAPINWARFRGTGARGIGDGQGAPSTWSAESGENVRWRVRVPGLAHSSPIVWGNRVFVTSAVSNGGDESLRTGLYGDVDSVDDDSKHSWRVYAYDKKTGDPLWEHTAIEGSPKSKRHLKSTHANPTPVTDGRYLVVHFGSEGLFCYDLEGDLLWQKEQGVLDSGWFYDSTYEWGFSSSPILHENTVITQIDVDKGSYIAAYDLATGREVWKTMRDEIPTWGSPVVLPGAGENGVDEIVTNGTIVRGYHAKSGEELWRLTPNSEVTVGSPVVADGVAYVTGGYPPVRPIYAIRPGGRGDLTLPEGETSSDHILWSVARGGTYIPTPIVYRGILYMLHNNGRMTAHDAATGELFYRERVGKAGSYSASPVAADGRLYFTSEEGVTTVVRAGKVFDVLETNELDEVVMTTPAISDGLLFVRGAQHLFALGEAPAKAAETASR
ncbi:MAG: PQQ-binding-like beta-propeller repeat protein [Acidobacteriota bacterium]